MIHHTFGPTTIAKVSGAQELKQLLTDPWLESETIIVKPNWVSTEAADFTDAETMKTLFETLDSRIIVTESYNLPRSMNLLDEGMSFTVGDEEVNWKWLLKGDGWRWLIENPEWDWFKSGGHWDHVKKEDQAFLDRYGFSDLFDKFDVTYVNVTEEVWSGRIADPTQVKKSVESRFKPVHQEKLYTMVPKVLYDLRGSTFISFAKVKMYASFTVKNLFGMIPDPVRPWWHGPKNTMIAESIVDINKIYHSLFNVYGICEALNSMGVIHPEGEFEGIYTGKYNVLDGWGVVAFGRDLVSLDAMLLGLTDPAIRLVADINREPIDMAEEEFGAYDRELIEDAKKKVGNWLSGSN
jgi:hypothetical protein